MAGDQPHDTIRVSVPKTTRAMEIIGKLGEYGILVIIPDLTYAELCKILNKNPELIHNPDERWKRKFKP